MISRWSGWLALAAFLIFVSVGAAALPPPPWLTLFTALMPGSVACYSAVQQWHWRHRPQRIGAISWFMPAMLAALSLEQVLSAVHTWVPASRGASVGVAAMSIVAIECALAWLATLAHQKIVASPGAYSQ